MSKVDLPLVPLGEVAKPVVRPVDVVPGQTYRTLGVKWWGEGAYERETIDGSKTAASQLYEVHEGDLIINKIWVRHGSIGIVPASMNGCTGSGEFPTFALDSERVLPRWIHWYSKTREMWGKCDALSQGTSGKNRIKPEKFLTVTVPLPPLSEQRRTVAKIEQLVSNIEEARGLRENSVAEVQALVRTTARQVFTHIPDSKIVPLETVCADIVDCLHSNPVYADDGIPTLRSPDVGWGTLLLETARRTGTAEYIRRTRRGEPQAGDIILVREGGGTGKAGIVEDGQQVSLGQRVMQLRPDRQKVLPRFLLHQWLSPTIQENQIADRMKGSASPHLNIKVLRKFDFFLPPLPEQRRIVAYLDDLQAKVDQLKARQAQTAAELDALLPSILDKAFKGEL